MKQKIELLAYLPEFLQRFREYQLVADAQTPEIERLAEEAGLLLDNSFIRTADIQGVKRWEKLLGISGAGELEERRAAVLGRWNRSLPYTMVRLYECLDALARRSEYRLLLSTAEYRLEMLTEDLPRGTLRAMRDVVRAMIPANMVFVAADRIPGAAVVMWDVQAALYMVSVFYPRYNTPPHYLDGATRLDGKYFLNGYLSRKKLEFYPLALQVRCEADGRAGLAASGRGMFCDSAAEAAESKAAMLVRSAGDATPIPAGRMRVSMSAGRVEDVTAAGYLRIEKNWKTLDGSKILDGSRVLDAEIYEEEI